MEFAPLHWTFGNHIIGTVNFRSADYEAILTPR